MSGNSSTAERRHGAGRRWIVVLVAALGLNGLVLGLAVAGLGNTQPTKAAAPVALSIPATEQVSDSAEGSINSAAEPVMTEQAEPTTAAPASESAMPDSAPVAEILAEIEPAGTQMPPLAVETSEVAPSEPCLNPAEENAEGHAPEPIVETPAAAAPTLRADVVVVINGPHTGGEVHFAIDGKLYSLQPGEYLQLPGDVVRTVAFHRGDDFGNEERELNVGAYVFRVGDTGWQVAEIPAAAAAALLQESRPQDAAE